MLLQWSLISPAVAVEEMPVGLQHLDSQSCWCDPLIETDANGDRSRDSSPGQMELTLPLGQLMKSKNAALLPSRVSA